MAERVFTPAHMDTAQLINPYQIIANRASGYEFWEGELHNQQWISESLLRRADGQLQMSILDFANWDAVVANRQLFKAETWQEILKPAVLNDGKTFPYGFGWSLENPKTGKNHIGHDGAWQGFISLYRRYDQDGISFVVLANTNRGNLGKILQGIAERFDEKYKNSK